MAACVEEVEGRSDAAQSTAASVNRAPLQTAEGFLKLWQTLPAGAVGSGAQRMWENLEQPDFGRIPGGRFWASERLQAHDRQAQGTTRHPGTQPHFSQKCA